MDLIKIFDDYQKNPKIFLDDDFHFYYDENNKIINLPCVTDLVDRKWGKDRYKDIPHQYLEMAIIKGNCVHTNVHNTILNSLPFNKYESCSHNVKTHQNAYDFAIKNLSKYFENGYLFFSELRFASDISVGSVDLIAVKHLNKYKTKWSVIIIDLKTSKDLHVNTELSQLKEYRHNIKHFLSQHLSKNQMSNITFDLEIWNCHKKKMYEPAEATKKDVLKNPELLIGEFIARDLKHDFLEK